MSVVGMMQATVDDIVYMLAVGNGLMSASRSVRMVIACYVRRAAFGHVAPDFKLVLVKMSFMRMMKVAIMQVVRMSVMPDSHVTAILAMRVFVDEMMILVARHVGLPFARGIRPSGNAALMGRFLADMHLDPR